MAYRDGGKAGGEWEEQGETPDLVQCQSRGRLLISCISDGFRGVFPEGFCLALESLLIVEGARVTDLLVRDELLVVDLATQAVDGPSMACDPGETSARAALRNGVISHDRE